MAEHGSVICTMATNIAPLKPVVFLPPLQSKKLEWVAESANFELLQLNISGIKFCLSTSLAVKFPKARLAELALQTDNEASYYFDRDPNLFNSILNFYRYGKFATDQEVTNLLKDEATFWKLPDEALKLIGNSELTKGQEIEMEFCHFENTITPPDHPTKWQACQHTVWSFMMDPSGPYTKHHRAAACYVIIMILLTVLFMTMFGMSTSRDFRLRRDGNQASDLNELQRQKRGKPDQRNSQPLPADEGQPLPAESPAISDEASDRPGLADQTTANDLPYPIEQNTSDKSQENQLDSLEQTDSDDKPGRHGDDNTQKPVKEICKTTKLMCYLETTPKPWVNGLCTILLIIFVIDTTVRFIFCPQKSIFLKSILNWFDIIATVVGGIYIPLQDVLEGNESEICAKISICLQAVQVLRLFRIFQYATFIDGLVVMLLTIKASLQELFLLVTYILIGMFLFSTIVMFVELDGQIVDNGGIKDCLYGYWWAIITMTTVGYGDFYPTTIGGYIVGIICAISGIILTALPVAVVGRNFNVYWDHNKKRAEHLRARLQSERALNQKPNWHTEKQAWAVNDQKEKKHNF